MSNETQKNRCLSTSIVQLMAPSKHSMRLTRIYQPQALITGQIINLSKEAAGHLIRVLRLQVGDGFILFNGEGGEFWAQLIQRNKNAVTARVGEYIAINRESPLQIILAQAVLRTEKMDYMLQKAVELGVDRFIPLLTAHSTLKLSPERWQKRCLHWQGIILAASEQSGRTLIPVLEKPMTLDMAFSAIKAEQRLILQPGAAENINSTLSCQSIALLVGPEGGWSENELKCAEIAGYSSVQLGPRVLRAETAGLVAVSIVQSLYGDL